MVNKVFKVVGLPTFSVLQKKLFLISYIGLINFILVIYASKFIKESISVPYNSEFSNFVNAFNLSQTIVSMLILYYFIRKIKEIIAYPFHDPPHFDINRIKEIKTTVITSVGYLLYLHDDIKSYTKLFDKLLFF